MLRRPLIQKNRRRARVLLYLAPVLLAGLILAVIHFAGRFHPDMAWGDVDYSEHEAVLLFQEYLRYDTSYPNGNEIPAAEFLARTLEAEGIEVHLERLGNRNANLWAILEGEERQALVLHNHIDVEPADPAEGWKHPPFGGVIDPPFIYGRGAFDMKSLGIAQLMSVLDLQRRGARLRRSLVFLATGDEERYSRLGTRRVLEQHPDLVARFDAVLTEGGAVEATDLSKVKYWGTDFLQKRFVDIWVCDGNRKRLEALRADLIARRAPSRSPTGLIARFLETYSDSRDNPAFRRLLSRPETIVEGPDFHFLPPYLKAMTRNELVAFPVEESPEGGYEMRLILHLLPDAAVEEGWEELLADELESFDYQVEIPHGLVGASPLDHPVFQAIHGFMSEDLPQVEHGPLFLPWVATDARFFRHRGIAAFGYSPFWIVSSDTIKMKGRNERMALPPFVEGVERYQRLVRRLVE